MHIEFDADKNAANLEKHGVSMARTVELAEVIVVEDARFEEPRFRLYGLIEGLAYCAAVTVRGDVMRVINLRRAHEKELRRHGF